MVEVSAVVVTYNNERTIEKCLSSLLSNNVQEIVVVDGGSNDKTVEIVTHHSGTRTIRNVRGIGKAKDTGWRISNSEFVLFLDADAFVQSDSAIEELLRRFSRPEIAGVTCRVTCANPHKLLPRLRDLDFQLTYPEGFKKSGIMNCNSDPTLCGIFRRRALQEVNGFDSSYPYGEDLQLLSKLQSRGYQILTVYEPAVLHYHRETLPELCVQFFYHGLGRRILMKEMNSRFYRHKRLRGIVQRFLYNSPVPNRDLLPYLAYRIITETSFLLGYFLGQT